MIISKDTALNIALAHREVETAEKLLAEVKESLGNREAPDIRDPFGRRQAGLQLGVPNGHNGHRLFDLDWSLACPIIEAHIAKQRAIIKALSETARVELSSDAQAAT